VGSPPCVVRDRDLDEGLGLEEKEQGNRKRAAWMVTRAMGKDDVEVCKLCYLCMYMVGKGTETGFSQAQWNFRAPCIPFHSR